LDVHFVYCSALRQQENQITGLTLFWLTTFYQMIISVEEIRKKFPILHRQVYGKPLVYLDNAATTQKPQVVIDRLIDYYRNENSNIHRGAHYLSQAATEAYEQARETCRMFLNAASTKEIIFTRGTTESVNLVASSFCKKFVNEGDEIMVSAMEHHSNIVPWQIACQERKAVLRVIPMNTNGELLMDEYKKLLTDKTRLVAVSHVSNSMGTINPVKEIIQIAKGKGIAVLVDGAQAVSHLEVDVKDLDCDFYCFSGHKVYGPMGVGVLYGKEQLLEELPPYQGGGEMIKDVSFTSTTFNELPFKFEAGTPNVGDVLGLETAIKFLLGLGIKNVAQHENKLLELAINQLSVLPNIRFIGTAKEKTSVVSFVFDDMHHYDAGVILDQLGIAVRTGHHCAQPVMDFFGVSGTIRASFAIYNTQDEIDVLINGLNRCRQMLA
jgi:cysteine desulfurase/selenocysteine lyase